MPAGCARDIRNIVPTTAIIVPCRLESTRFPRKLLHPIRGKPLLLWVAQRIAAEAPEFPLYFAVDHERLREAVASHGFMNSEGEPTEQITISIGLSTYPGTASDREGLLRRADDALYVVKRSGRNRVSASPAGVEEMRARDQELERREQVAYADERGGL